MQEMQDSSLRKQENSLESKDSHIKSKVTGLLRTLLFRKSLYVYNLDQGWPDFFASSPNLKEK